ncbi:hypothetical protein V496_09930, partial [Pseudogymnoascus sp. VKM F-4515 (FW-2607)]
MSLARSERNACPIGKRQDVGHTYLVERDAVTAPFPPTTSVVSEKGVQHAECSNIAIDQGSPDPIHPAAVPPIHLSDSPLSSPLLPLYRLIHHGNHSGDSTTSWDVATPSPSRSDFFGNYDRDGFSASPGPMFASSLSHQFNVPSSHALSMGDQSLMYPETFHRSLSGQDHMSYELHTPLPLPIGSPAFLPEQHY